MSTKNKNSLPASPNASAAEPAEGYKVGPGHPPREYKFKPGQSGNPKGAKRKAPTLAPDIKALLAAALSKPIKLKQGEHERTVTMLSAAIEQMVAQAVKGDHRARRDLFALADKAGLDLNQGSKVIEEALTANRQAILRNYVARQSDTVVTPAPVFAPPELLDDDTETPE